MVATEIAPTVYQATQLAKAELSPGWLIPREQEDLYTGYVMPVDFDGQLVELPVMRVAENESICWLDFRRPDLAIAAAPANADMIVNLPEKPILLIGARSSKSEGELNLITGLVQIDCGDQSIEKRVLRGGKKSDLEKQGVGQITYFEGGENEKRGLWYGLGQEGNVCWGVKCTPITAEATNEPKFFYWTESEWREIIEIIQKNPERAMVLWDDVYSTGATLEGIEWLMRTKIDLVNEGIRQRLEAQRKDIRIEKEVRMEHFYRVVTAWEAKDGEESPENLRFAIQIPVIQS